MCIIKLYTQQCNKIYDMTNHLKIVTLVRGGGRYFFCNVYLAHYRESETFFFFFFLTSGKKSDSLFSGPHKQVFKSSVCYLVLAKFLPKKIVIFCPGMSEHLMYVKNVTNLTKTLHQNVTNVTKQNVAPKEIPTIEFHTKYVKLFVNMLSMHHLCIAQCKIP